MRSAKVRARFVGAAAMLPLGLVVGGCVTEVGNVDVDVDVDAETALTADTLEVITAVLGWTFSSSSSTDGWREPIIETIDTFFRLDCSVVMTVYYVEKEKLLGSHDFIGARFEITCPGDKEPYVFSGAYGLTELGDLTYFEQELQKEASPNLRFLGRLSGRQQVIEVLTSIMERTTSWQDYLSNGPFQVCRLIASPVPELGKPCTKAATEIETAIRPTLAPPSSPCSYDTSSAAGQHFQNCCQSCFNAGARAFAAYYNWIIPNRCTCEP